MTVKGPRIQLPGDPEFVRVTRKGDSIVLESRAQRGDQYTPDRVVLEREDAVRLADYIIKEWGKYVRR